MRSEISLIEIAPLCFSSIESIMNAQKERYETMPRSEIGRSGVPSFFSRFESSYEKAIISLP